MFKTTAVPIVACAVLAGASTSKAQQFTTQKPRLSEDAWHNHGWGFAGPGVYNEKDPSKRKRLAGLLHMAHVYAAAQLFPALRNTLSGFPSAAAMALGLATFVPANPALAATFANTDAATITIAGRIDQGDEQKFFAARGYAPNFRKLVVNSPGGSILPAIIIGKGLRTGSYEVQVAESGECGSACTLLLAAATERSAYSSSRIAVHSASTFDKDGTRKPETDDDLTVTAKLARLLKDWGTPPVIIGKMMGTPGEDRENLTDSDLQAWNVRIIRGYTPPPSYNPPPSPPYNPPPPADTRSKGQRIYDFVLRSEGTPMSKFSEIIAYNWTGKVEYFNSMGAQFTKNCGGGTCTYRGELWSPNQQVRYYVQNVNGERVFCVKNYRTGLGACANQDTDEVIYLRMVGPSRIESASRSVPPTPSVLNLSLLGLGTSRTIMRHSRRLRAPRQRGSSLAPRPFFSAMRRSWPPSRRRSDCQQSASGAKWSNRAVYSRSVPGSQLCIGARPVMWPASFKELILPTFPSSSPRHSR